MRAVSGDLWFHFITLKDYVLLPFYLFAIYFIFNNICNRKYPKGHPWRPYFRTGFFLKIAGSIFISLAYQYYYAGGDTSVFFYHGQVINSALGESVTKWFNLLFHIPSIYDGEYFDYTSQMLWYDAPSSYLVSGVAGIVSLITFNTYLPTAVIFGAIAFSGSWALFRTFALQYPKHIRYIAIAALYIPSTLVWGSGIFKDTLCLFALGWVTYGAFQVLIQRNFSWKNILLIIICFYVLAVVKVYILLAFAPALAIWVLFMYSKKINPPFLRTILNIFLIALCVGGFYYISSSFSSELGAYSLNNITETSNITRTYISYVSGDDGSAYDLGAFDPSVTGMLKKLPLAVNVALFRPYLWEARKPMVLLNALEAFLFLFYTLKVIFSVGLIRIWKTIREEPNIQFFLIFTVIFAFAVGLTSANFGALSRYRIPCLPFYALSLILIYYKNKPENSNFFSFRLIER